MYPQTILDVTKSRLQNLLDRYGAAEPASNLSIYPGRYFTRAANRSGKETHDVSPINNEIMIYRRASTNLPARDPTAEDPWKSGN